jgi:hypothetical protein
VWLDELKKFSAENVIGASNFDRAVTDLQGVLEKETDELRVFD